MPRPLSTATDNLPRPPLEQSLHEPIPLHEGTLDARSVSGSSVELAARVYLDWLPTPRIVADVAGHIPDDERHIFLELIAQGASTDPRLVVEAPSLSEVSQPSTLSDLPSVGGNVTFTGNAELSSRDLGRRGSRPDTITFNVVNGPELWRASQDLTAAGWVLKLEESADNRALRREASATGGYCTTHRGTLRRIRGGRFTVTEGERVLKALSLFLTFLAGRWVGTALPIGSVAGKKVWESWGDPSLVDRYRGTLTWFDQTETSAALALFPKFLELIADPNEFAVLRRAISFLVLANRGVPVDPGFSLAVSGLEFLGWHTQVTHGPLTSKKWDEKMYARQRIDHLLGWASIPSSLPSELNELRKALPGKSGPECVVTLRNRFIHPRPTDTRHPFDAYVEGWLLAAWYLELVILFWLGYEGRYMPRLAANRWTGATEAMPWQPTSRS